MQSDAKRIVYILRSDRDPKRHYVGMTANLQKRLECHNAGQNTDTIKDRPWSIVASLEFPNEEAARHFERYLKSGSGRAFAKRHFDPKSGTERHATTVTPDG